MVALFIWMWIGQRCKRCCGLIEPMKNKESFCPLSGGESFKKASPHHHQLLAPDYSRVSILTPNELGVNYF